MSNASNVKIAEATATSSAVSSQTYVRVTWRDMVITAQTLYIYTSYQVTAQGGSNGGEQEKNKNFRVWINDDIAPIFAQTGSLPNNQYTAILLPNNNPISKVRVNMTVTGNSYIALGPSMTPDATAQFDYTANITQIGDNDFIFVKNAGTNNDGKYFLMLPDVTTSIKARFIKTVGTNKFVWVLNNPSSGASMPNEIGDSGLGLGRSTLFFQAYPSDPLSKSYSCLTLISDLTNWEIANYYPSPWQGLVPQTTYTVVSTSKLAVVANPNSMVTLFESLVANGDGRDTGKNTLILANPQPTNPPTPTMTVVLYGGNSAKNSSNSLIIAPDIGCTIDGLISPQAGGVNAINIYSDSSQKSAGIVFISDGIDWYIAGYYYAGPWTVSNASNAGTSLLPSSSPQQCLIVPPATSKFYALPKTIPSSIPGYASQNTCIAIIKKKYNNPATAPLGEPVITFASYVNGEPSANRINGTTPSVLYLDNPPGNNRQQLNMCVWFFGLQRNYVVDYIDWYPAITYTPNAS